MCRGKMVNLIITFYIITLGIFIFFLFSYFHNSRTSLTKEEQGLLEEMRELVIVGDANFPPLSFTDAKKQFSGYEADLAKALETRLGVNIKYTQMNWPEAIKSLKNHQAMAILGMKVTAERARIFNFTRPYWKTSYVMVALSGTDIGSLLKKQPLYVLVEECSATKELFLQQYPRKDVEFLYYKNPEEAVHLLTDKDADLWMENYQIARYSIMKSEYTNLLEFFPITINSSDYAMAFASNYAKLVPIFNKALLSLRNDGTLAALDKKWFGLVDSRVDPVKRIFWVVVLIFTVFTVLIVVLISNIIFKKIINEKTEQHRLLLDNIPIQIWYMKNKDTYGLVNEAHAEFLGMEREQLEGKNVALTRLLPEEIERMVKYNEDVMKFREPLFTEESVSDLAGQVRIFQVTRTPKLDSNGDVAYIVCSAEDITNLKMAEQALREGKTKIERLHEIAIKMERCRVEDDVYKLIIRAAEGILNFAVCSVDVVEGEYFIVKATSSAIASNYSRNLPITQGIGGKTYLTGKTYLIDDIWANEDASPASQEYRSCISAPIGSIGVFQAISNKVKAFSEEDVELTELLLSHAAEAIKRIRSEDKIRYMSFHDSLTGLYNRAFFDEELERLNSERYLPLSIVMGDTNGLKLVNDVFGHEKGDRLIARIANILQRCGGEVDTIFRWGGDEFAVLLPKTDEKAAQAFCECVKDACLKAEMDPILPSISLGYATKEQPEDNINDCLKEAENRMYRNKLAESRAARNTIIASLEKTLWEKSFETEAHARRLQRMSNAIGRALHLSESQLEDLHLAAALHDIGNIAIPESVIKKHGQLDDEEWEVLRRHAESGYRIAQSSPELGPIAEAILSHHERWDGKGYPEGLKGEGIPLLSRIIAIVDAYDVMTQGRPYKAPIGEEAAMEEIKRCAGSQFDPELVDLFLEIFADHEEA